MPCGCRDPLGCDHHDGPPSERMVDGYREAAHHLLDAGLTPYPFLPELRVLWARGGDDQRFARQIAERWELAA